MNENNDLNIVGETSLPCGVLFPSFVYYCNNNLETEIEQSTEESIVEAKKEKKFIIGFSFFFYSLFFILSFFWKLWGWFSWFKGIVYSVLWKIFVYTFTQFTHFAW